MLAACGGGGDSHQVEALGFDAEADRATILAAEGSDRLPPVLGPIAISDPTPEGVVALNGTASDDSGVARVRWFNDRGGDGRAELSPLQDGVAWKIAAIQLQPGDNKITIRVRDLAGNLTRDDFTLVRGPSALPSPQVRLSGSSTRVPGGVQGTLTWQARNAVSCEAGGGWSGPQALSGTYLTPVLPSTTSFSLTCQNASGVKARSVVTFTVSSF